MPNTKIIVTGHHLNLCDATRADIERMADKLLLHHAHIARVRFETDVSAAISGKQVYTVTGIVELRGPDLVASESTDNLYKSVHAVVDKLQRMLNERTHKREAKRHSVPLKEKLARMPPT